MKIIFPNAIDFLRTINDNAVDNALGGRSAYLLLPSLYERAYAIVHETGEYPIHTDIIAPDESVSSQKAARVAIITGRSN
jgi:hypothetical protein